MRLRTLRAALIASALVFAPLVAMASPVAAQTFPATVCAVAGTVNVNPGVGQLPPGANNDGNYDFDQVALVCVGGLTGVGTSDSAGGFGVGNCGGVDVDLVGSFCGGYNTSGFVLGGGCAGTVGGDEAANLNPANVLASDWSVTFGPLITGGITCGTSIGVLALVGIPNPLATDGDVAGIDIPLGECTDPANHPLDPGVAAVFWCQIAIAGVAVFAL